MLRKCFIFTKYIRQKELKILNEKADFTQSTQQLLRNCFNFLGEQRASTCQSWPNITSQSHRLTSFCRSTFLQMGRLDYMSGESSEEKPQTKRSLIGSLLSQLMRYTSTQSFANKRSVKTLPKAQRTRGLSSYHELHTNLDQISFSESRPSVNFKISTKYEHLD